MRQRLCEQARTRKTLCGGARWHGRGAEVHLLACAPDAGIASVNSSQVQYELQVACALELQVSSALELQVAYALELQVACALELQVACALELQVACALELQVVQHRKYNSPVHGTKAIPATAGLSSFNVTSITVQQMLRKV